MSYLLQVTKLCARFSDRQLFIGVPFIKGAIFGPGALAVVEASISPFAKALILTLLSAIVSGLFLIIGAFITTRRVEQRVLQGQEELKSQVGGRRQEDDDHNEPSS